jgi:hypothetical protein
MLVAQLQITLMITTNGMQQIALANAHHLAMQHAQKLIQET